MGRFLTSEKSLRGPLVGDYIPAVVCTKTGLAESTVVSGLPGQLSVGSRPTQTHPDSCTPSRVHYHYPSGPGSLVVPGSTTVGKSAPGL